MNTGLNRDISRETLIKEASGLTETYKRLADHDRLRNPDVSFMADRAAQAMEARMRIIEIGGWEALNCGACVQEVAAYTYGYNDHGYSPEILEENTRALVNGRVSPNMIAIRNIALNMYERLPGLIPGPLALDDPNSEMELASKLTDPTGGLCASWVFQKLGSKAHLVAVQNLGSSGEDAMEMGVPGFDPKHEDAPLRTIEVEELVNSLLVVPELWNHNNVIGINFVFDHQ